MITIKAAGKGMWSKALLFFSLILVLLQTSAAAFTQRISISVHNAPLEKVLKEVHKQSGFLFLYSAEQIHKAKPVTVSVKEASLEDVLHKCFEGQPFSYELKEKTILIKYHQTSLSAFTPVPVKVSGKVTDESGAPVSGVTVSVKGTNVNTVTNANGVYSITVAAGSGVLQFVHVGYTLKEAEVKSGSSAYDVVLVQKANELSEVIIAYGATKNTQLTNSVAQISSKDIEKRPISHLSNALVGAAPGVQTNAGSGQPGSGPAIRIRGFGSVTGENSPLFVVDGGIYDGALNSISPDDIESISVLKDASASALYGARAANGVIIVTTKKGKKNTNQVNLRATRGYVSRGLADYEKVDAYEYYPLIWESYRNSLLKETGPSSGTTMSLADANAIASGTYIRFTSGTNAGKQNYNGRAYNDISQQLVYNPFNVDGNAVVGTDGKINPEARIRSEYDDLDWNKAVRRTGTRDDYLMSASGGTDKSNYYVSLNYLKEQGFSIGSDFNRITGRVKVNSQPKKWFNTGFNVAGTISKTKTANEDGGTWENPFYPGLILAPIFPLYEHDASGAFVLDDNGNKIYDSGDLRPFSPGRNIVAETELNELWNKRNLLSGRAFAEIKFLNDFRFTTNVNVDINTYSFSRYRNNKIGDMVSVGGRSTRTNSNSQWFTVNELLNYNKTIGKHTVEALLGHESYRYQYNYLNAVGTGQIVEGSTELANFSTYLDPNSYTDEYTTEGYFSRVQYSYSDRYSAMASFRRDGSSKFYKDVRWGNFWSVSAAWNISNEKFFRVKWMDNLKLRASYGQVGSDGVSGYYPWQSLYDVGFSNGNEAGIKQNTAVGNQDLKWESNNSYDVALEASVLKNRVSATIEFFHRESNNLLFSMPLPVATGLSSVPVNYGSMFNRGVEVQVSGDAVRTKDFTWNVVLNWTTFANKITELPFGKRINGTKQWEVGHSMYDFYLRRVYGVDPANGSQLYLADDLKASGVRVDDKGNAYTADAGNAKYEYSGKATPDYYGSVKNGFTYKQISLDFTFLYSLGGKVFDSDYQSIMGNGAYGRALHKDALKRWTPENTSTNIPRRDIDPNAFNSDRWLIDGSYLNFRTISLTYTFPRKWVKKLSLSNVNVYASGENLFILSHRKGLDPTQTFTGAPSYTYAPARTIAMGINVGF